MSDRVERSTLLIDKSGHRLTIGDLIERGHAAGRSEDDIGQMLAHYRFLEARLKEATT